MLPSQIVAILIIPIIIIGTILFFVIKKKHMYYTPYFQNGLLIKVKPPIKNLYENRDIVNKARFIVSDNIKYDLENLNSINSISIPKFEPFTQSIIGVTGNLDYVLRMHPTNNPELKLAILKKAQEMMQHSNIPWRKKDYKRLSTLYRELGMFKEAADYDLYLERTKPKDDIDLIIERRNKEVIKEAESLGIDLVEMNHVSSTCEYCAMMQDRVYSISGNDKRFPSLPDEIYVNGTLHQGCRHALYIFEDRKTLLIGEDAITYSNRPFIDNRTEEEKKEYEEYKKHIEYEKLKEKEKEKYLLLQYKCPEIAPKTFGAYMRMRNANTSGYIKLKEKASKIGIKL